MTPCCKVLLLYDIITTIDCNNNESLLTVTVRTDYINTTCSD